MTRHFALFGLPEQFHLDDTLLEQNYRLLAAKFHPDKTTAASAFEQKQAVMMAAAVNEAYRILKNPTDRAAYLLQAEGIDADAPEHTAFAPEFLMQQMEWRETLDDARMMPSENGKTEKLEKLSQEIKTVKQNTIQLISSAFQQKNFGQAAVLVREMRFLDKLQQEIQTALP